MNEKSQKLYADIKIFLTPKSSKNEITGKEEDFYRIRITSPPVDGKANQALISFLSKKIKTSKKDIEIIRGEKSRYKTLRVHGFSSKNLDDLLGKS